MRRNDERTEWLSLIDVSGPFLAPAVLDEVFPQGLEKVETPRRRRIRAAYEEWRDAVDDGDPQLVDLHAAWTRIVLEEALEYEDAILIPRGDGTAGLSYSAPEHGTCVEPDYAVRSEDGALRLLVAVHGPGSDLDRPSPDDRWPASPAEKMTLLCRAQGVRLGLVTDGEQWMLVNAPIGGTSGYATWFARLWWQEPVTFKAFVSLLGVRRCFGPPEGRLDQMLERSLGFQEEVTDTLGEQVRRAVEVLVQALGRADQDREGELLRDVSPAVLFEAGLTIMMRLVFVLCAEERRLLLLGDPTYDQHYAISTLRARLREDADRLGLEVLERRHDAWSRMLATFRAVYGGIDHEAIRLPALGGSLFDPDRFPFLEGRPSGTSWRDTPANPLPIDNRTSLLLLEALQILEQARGARLLSYRALDVEQIGHVYEGLLEYTVAQVSEVSLGLIGSKKASHPIIALRELETLHAGGASAAAAELAEITGRNATTLKNALARTVDESSLPRLVQACGGDEKLARRVLPFAEIVRPDSWGTPVIYRKGTFAVTPGPTRRETGTHYTPQVLTETIVEKTLGPVVYAGPADGEPPEKWRLRSPAELLDLKVCDPAMGSGAFLVQTCRYLAERLVESWGREEEAGRIVTVDGIVVDPSESAEPLPPGTDERLVIARRLVAERCLYGVDLNPLAVELAKLSIWLVTLAKGRPFGFLDHNLRCGDSLLGIHRLDQLIALDMQPSRKGRQGRLFGKSIEKAVGAAVELRTRLRQRPIRDIKDVEAMASLDQETRRILEGPELLADALIADVLQFGARTARLDAATNALAIEADKVIDGDGSAIMELRQRVDPSLRAGAARGEVRRPFHWALEFPEVVDSPGGFNAVMGNPPWASYSGRQAATLSAADERYYSSQYRLFDRWKTLHSLFMERALAISSSAGSLGILLPAQVADLDGYGAVRKAVRSQKTVVDPIPYFGEAAFSGVIQPTCALIAHARRADEGSIASEAPFSLAPAACDPAPQSENSAAEGTAADFSVILRKLEAGHLAPADAFADPGVHSGNCSKKIVLARPDRSGTCAPVREGKNVFPYRCEEPSKWLLLSYEAADTEYFTIRSLETYVQFPILLRQTAKRPVAAAHSNPTYFRNSVLACRGLPSVPLELVLAWLNSSAVGVFHMTKVREANQRVFPQVKVKHLRALPLPDWKIAQSLLSTNVKTLVSKAGQGDVSALDELDTAISFAFGLTDVEHGVLRNRLSELLGE